MRNILNINSDWILSTEKTPDGKAVHKRILPLNKEDEYCYYLELLGAAPSMEVFVNQEKSEITPEAIRFTAWMSPIRL